MSGAVLRGRAGSRLPRVHGVKSMRLFPQEAGAWWPVIERLTRAIARVVG
jgi:hypothetical protein